VTQSFEETTSALIKQEAKKLGFSFCGISKASFLEEEAPRLEKWLSENKQGEMHYMENHFDKRLDPRLLVEDAKSVISLMYNYYTDIKQADATAPKISKYAYGQDYHHVIKFKLKQLMEIINEKIGEVNGSAFVDSAPVMDKAWAKKSGLGWMGKNTNIINKNAGSFFFIAELILDIPLKYDHAVKDHCGTCTACIDACPTDAISEPYVVDGSKCISYFTIELKKEIPSDVSGKFENWMFGCDICQDVCHWNRFSKQHSSPQLLNMNIKEWEEITEDVFKKLFKKSAVKRTGYKGLKRNIAFLKTTE
jgi:epoxyqueuosine reductase